MLRIPLHIAAALMLTVLTQIGGLAWLCALIFRRRLIAFVVLYAGFSFAMIWSAPHFGRVALSCFADGPLQVQSPFYCMTNRNYVDPRLAGSLQSIAQEMDRRHPGTITLVLDANFPLFDGFPLLPHLSHDDGEKVDLAFYYRDDARFLPGATRSPVGYFAFERGHTHCPETWPTLRWDFEPLQPMWRDLSLDEPRNATLLRLLSDDPAISRIFVEPHVVESLDVSSDKIGFQGCRAARHDDHIHLQL